MATMMRGCWLPVCFSMIIVFGLCLSGAESQSTDVNCTAEHEWMSNSRGQNPCLVFAYLNYPCQGSEEVVALTTATGYYVGPSVQDDCMCNTVMYSVIEACQLCQFDSIEDTPIPWSSYAEHCDTTVDQSYPKDISSGTAIPEWAYLDVITDDTFNVTVAQMVASAGLPDITSSSASQIPTTSSTPSYTNTDTETSSTVTTSSSKPSSSAVASGPAAASSKHSNVGSIVGGVVGGVFALCLIGTLVFYILLKQRRLDRAPRAQVEPRPMSEMEGTVAGRSVTPFGFSGDAKSPAMSSAVLYDPNDSRTFPPELHQGSFIARATSPTPSNQGSSMAPMPGFAIAPGYAGSDTRSIYRGIPEV